MQNHAAINPIAYYHAATKANVTGESHQDFSKFYNTVLSYAQTGSSPSGQVLNAIVNAWNRRTGVGGMEGLIYNTSNEINGMLKPTTT